MKWIKTEVDKNLPELIEEIKGYSVASKKVLIVAKINGRIFFLDVAYRLKKIGKGGKPFWRSEMDGHLEILELSQVIAYIEIPEYE